MADSNYIEPASAPIPLEPLLELLRSEEDGVMITFKKVDGVIKEILGTLHKNNLPVIVVDESKPKPAPKKVNEDVVNFYSIVDNGWRSFRKENLIKYSVRVGQNAYSVEAGDPVTFSQTFLRDIYND
jgi:hypothetical protein